MYINQKQNVNNKNINFKTITFFSMNITHKFRTLKTKSKTQSEMENFKSQKKTFNMETKYRTRSKNINLK